MSRTAKPYTGAIYFVRFSPFFANQYAQERVHPTRNLPLMSPFIGVVTTDK